MLTLTHDDFSALFEAFAPRLRAGTMAAGHSAHLADEVVAETFARAWEHRERFDTTADGSVEAWLYAISRNVLGRWNRDGRVASRNLPRLAAQDGVLTADHAGDSDERLTNRIAGSDVRRALETLPAAQRQAISMRVVEEREYSDIAASVGADERVVRARVSRGLRILAVIASCIGVGVALLATTAVGAELRERMVALYESLSDPQERDQAADVASKMRTEHVRPGASGAGWVRASELGAGMQDLGDGIQVRHSRRGEYVISIPTGGSGVIPGTQIRVASDVRGTPLDVPDLATGARLYVTAGIPRLVGRPGDRRVELAVGLRRLDPVSPEGLRCLRAQVARTGMEPIPYPSMKRGIGAAMDACAPFHPDVRPEYPGGRVEIPQPVAANVGTPVDLEGYQALSVVANATMFRAR